MPQSGETGRWAAQEFPSEGKTANTPLRHAKNQIHRSSSWLMRRFRAELGMSVGDYITKCKMDEACELLTYSDRTLSQISAYLGYSSQSYFQNVFRKQLSMTPMQYRRQGRLKTAPE